MRIIDIRQGVVPISRFADPDVPSGGLVTSIVALVTDVVRDGHPVVGYGLPGYLRILRALEGRGWSRSAFRPHGGHLFCLHVVNALGLGGAEVNPLCFQPFGGLGDAVTVRDGHAASPDVPGIGFETMPALHELFASLL